MNSSLSYSFNHKPMNYFSSIRAHEKIGSAVVFSNSEIHSTPNIENNDYLERSNPALDFNSKEPLPSLSELIYDYDSSDSNLDINKKCNKPKGLNISQKRLIEQFKIHISIKHRSPHPALSERGYCLALACIYGVRMLKGEGAKYESELEAISKYSDEEIQDLPDRIDTPIEKLFNLLQWAQQGGRLLNKPQINPLDADKDFTSDLSLTLTGTPRWCAKLLFSTDCIELDGTSLTPENTIILARYFTHAVCLFRNEHGLKIYNPDNESGSKIIRSQNELAEELFKANGGGDFLTLSIDLYRHSEQNKVIDLPNDIERLMAEEMEFNGFINKSDVNGYTALLNACRQGHTKAAEALIEYGANINQASHQGVTPLMIAALRGNVEIVKLLIDHGANLADTDNSGSTALMLATEYQHKEVMDILINHGREI